ncbi:MAG: hypothetical protein KIT54_03945 [Phycisphaeraceae bacterium]|nr:hypothetical protein [Phycisphaeraceae bacterium]
MADAQDRSAMVERVASASQQAADVRVPMAERVHALERALAERGVLLQSLPDDAHRAIWLLDQAGDVLFLLSMRLADTRALVGLPDLDDLAATHAAVTRAIDLASEAGVWIEDRFVRQRAILDAGGELAEGDRALNRRLADVELAVRRPLLLGRALVLRGTRDDSSQAAALLDNFRPSDGRAPSTRDVALAIALAKHQPDRSTELLQGVVSRADLGVLARAEAALLLARMQGDHAGVVRAIDQAATKPPFVDEQGLADSALLVLATEARARVLFEAGRVEQAAQHLMELEDRREMGGTAPQRRGVADARLAALAERVEDWTGISSPIVLRAGAALVSRDRRPDDAKAAQILAGLVERFDAQEREASRTGRPWSRPPEHDRAMELLARLLLVMADHELEDAIAQDRRVSALRLVSRLIGSEHATLDGLLPQAATHALGPAGQSLDVQTREALLQGALDRWPEHPQAHPWRLGLATSKATRPGTLEVVLSLAEAAIQSPDPRVRSDAIALAAAAHAVRITQADDKSEAGRTALAHALEFARSHPEGVAFDARALALRLAEIWVEQGRLSEAQRALATLEGFDGPRAIVLRARAYDTLGRAEAAFVAYRAASEQVTLESDARVYWLVWTRLLELLNVERLRRNEIQGSTSGEALAGSIRGHLLRLRAIDASLGGPPWAERLKAIETSLSGPR